MTSKQFYSNYKIQVYIIIYKGLRTFSTYFKLAKIAFDNFIYDYGDLKGSVWSVSTNYKFSRRLAINWKYQKFWCRFTKSHESELWIWLFINSTWSCTGVIPFEGFFFIKNMDSLCAGWIINPPKEPPNVYFCRKINTFNLISTNPQEWFKH